MEKKQKEAKIVARIKITDLEGLSIKGRKELVEWLKNVVLSIKVGNMKYAKNAGWTLYE